MDVERALVTRLAQKGEWEEVVAAGVDSGHWHDPECRAIFDFIVGHAKKYGTPPSFKAVRESEAGKPFGFEPTTDALKYLIDRFVGQVKRRMTLESLEEVARMLDDPQTDLLTLDESMFEMASRLAHAVPGSRITDFREMGKRIARYRQEKKDGTWAGIPMGIADFDTLTMGVQQHEFVSVAGWQGTGKSTLMAYAAFYAYISSAKSPLIFSLEMGGDELMRKFDIMALNWERDNADMVQHINLKGHDLSEKEIQAWGELNEKVKNLPSTVMVVDDVGNPTVERVYSDAVRWKPDCVFIDYISLMQPPRVTENMWQDLTRLTRQLKLMARTLKVPVWGLAQTNVAGQAEGALLHNIAYTRSIGQDSDIVLGLFATPEMKANNQMEVRMLKNRDGRPTETKMRWRPDVMHFEPWQDHHLFEAKFENQAKAITG